MVAAMLGLRSLYFLLAGKLEISPLLSVAVIAGLLLATTLVERVRRPVVPRSVNSVPGS